MEELKMFDVVYADLSDGKVGSEQSGIHPYIIIQNNQGNAVSPTFLGMSLTSGIKKEYLPTHTIIHKTVKNGLRCDSTLLGETLTQIDKKRIIKRIGYIDNVKEQNDVINVFLANATGKKSYNPFWNRIVCLVFKLIREGEYGNAA